MTAEKFLVECEARLKLAEAELYAICTGKEWRMCIPIQPDDSDMVIRASQRDIERLIEIARVMQKAIEEISPVFEIGREEFDKLRLVSTLPHELDTCSIIVREMKARVEEIARGVK